MTAPSARELRDAVASGTLTAVEATKQALDACARAQSACNAFVTIAAEQALARAARIDAALDPTLPLLGVPIAIKDNICVRGMRMTAGSRVLEHYVPPYDATVVQRLERAGAIVVGKTNCDEFAMGSSTEHSAFGASRNPWDPSRIPGGSSGGSAIAVASGAVPLALGSETGGSVRQPAALCGILGLKPTYGRISRYGLLAFASSLDQVGIFGRTAGDVSACLSVIAGVDPRDATTATQPVDDAGSGLDGALDGLTMGVPRALLAGGVEAGVLAAFESTLDALQAHGAVIREIDLPHGRFATPAYALVVTAEASSNLARYDGVRYGTRPEDAATLDDVYARSRALFGREVKRRIMLGTFVLSEGYYDAYYAKALEVARLIRRDYDVAFAEVDVVATPTSPTVAFPLGARTEDPVSMYLADTFTASANLAKVPAISIPCGLSGGLPVGLQLTAPAWGEGRLLNAAAACEGLRPWSGLQPAG